MTPQVQILTGDCRELLKTLPDESVQCCVTSPPYWGLRDYGTGEWEGGDPSCEHRPNVRNGSGRADGKVDERGQRNRGGVAGLAKARHCECGATRVDKQIGMEKTPEEYVAALVQVFREVRRILKPDGTLWLNLGDSYATGAGSARSPGGKCFGKSNKVIDEGAFPVCQPNRMPIDGLKPKDLIGMPWRVAFALQADGWWLRSDIIWHKPNPMPESVEDRPTKAHEYLFLMTKAEHYFYDAEAIKENVTGGAHRRYKTPDGGDTSKGEGGHGAFHRNGREKGHTGYIHVPSSYKGSVPGRKDGPGQERRSERARGKTPKSAPAGSGIKANDSFHEAGGDLVENRNKRSVWTVSTAPYPEAHFATYPPDLIKPCILAGTKAGDTVLDPFGGSGTTGQVAIELGRSAILIELNESYVDLIRKRTDVTPGLNLA